MSGYHYFTSPKFVRVGITQFDHKVSNEPHCFSEMLLDLLKFMAYRKPRVLCTSIPASQVLHTVVYSQFRPAI